MNRVSHTSWKLILVVSWQSIFVNVIYYMDTAMLKKSMP